MQSINFNCVFDCFIMLNKYNAILLVAVSVHGEELLFVLYVHLRYDFYSFQFTCISERGGSPVNDLAELADRVSSEII